MDTPLIRFVRQHQISLISIFCKEQSEKGDGVLWIKIPSDNNLDVHVAYYKLNDIPSEACKEKVIEQNKLLDSETETLELENRLIIDLPPFNPQTVHFPYIPLLNIVLEENGSESFFFGFPRELENTLQYNLIGTPPDERIHSTDLTLHKEPQQRE